LRSRQSPGFGGTDGHHRRSVSSRSATSMAAGALMLGGSRFGHAPTRGGLGATAPAQVLSAQQENSDTQHRRPSGSQLTGTPCEVVNTAAMSGEVLLTVPDANSKWTVSDVLHRLKAQAPLPDMQRYRLSCGPTPATSNCMLESVITGESEPRRVEFASMVVRLQERPDVDAAWSELASSKKNDVMEVRSVQRPPMLVEMTFKALMLFLGMPGTPDFQPENTGGELWAAIKTQLLVSREHLLELIQTLDLDECDASATLERTRPFLDDVDFQPTNVGRASSFGAKLCAWIRASASFLERRLGDER